MRHTIYAGSTGHLTHRARTCALRQSLTSGALVTALALTAALLPAPAGAAAATAAAETARPDAITPDGGQYFGKLVNGKLDGPGRIVWANGVRYDGSFKQGLYAGRGALTYADGRTYRGGFSNGMFQGQGRYALADGQIFDGQFVRGAFEGQGTYLAADGARHVGRFKNWLPDGPGVLTDADGNVYRGSFAAGELAGKALWQGIDGSTYEGAFRNLQFSGQGLLRNAQGDAYLGSFKAGVFDGPGVLTYAPSPKEARAPASGIWSAGELLDPVADQLTRTNVEAALYSQGPLLDQALATLLPHQAGKINMYLLAVGGDGSQEVFRRETEFVQKQFDRDFGTAGRSMTLVNSRSTVTQRPMATQTSLRKSLDTIASRMDKDNDILFLFLTSHGSKTHELSLQQNGMELADLPAATLGQMLKQSGIRWKVVLVSACYSGGFIPALKDERTLVITAARPDRTSFGCADENEFTYFSEAYFKDALPASGSFAQAFKKAQVLVTRREADDIKADGVTGEEAASYHSEPQMADGPAINQYLAKWRAQLGGGPR
jgi:hypothetical protein